MNIADFSVSVKYITNDITQNRKTFMIIKKTLIIIIK